MTIPIPNHDTLKTDSGLTDVLTKIADAVNALEGADPDTIITTRGDLIRGAASGDAERVALGATSTFLQSDGTDAVWSTILGTEVVIDSTALVGVGVNVQTVLEELDDGIADHLADTSAAHAASAISVDSTTLTGTGTDVQAVFEELDNADALLAPLADPTFTGTATADVVAVTGTLKHGTVPDGYAVKGTYVTGTIAVTVPAVTDPDVGSVDVDISSDPLTFAAAVGDSVEAIPLEAMETNARIVNAYVIGADSVRVVFASLGGDITGGAKNFSFKIVDLT